MARRILVVDDSEFWRRYLSSTLQRVPGLQVIDSASDGFEAVQKAQELKPDLILLDVGLPTLNGIEAARQIRQLSRETKLLFCSENRARDFVEEALRIGAGGYIVKSDAGHELVPAVKAVLRGEQFLSAGLTRYDPTHDALEQKDDNLEHPEVVGLISSQKTETTGRHEVWFSADNRELPDGVTQFIGSALQAGNAVIVVAFDPHRDSLVRRLQAQGINVGACTEEGRYIPLHPDDAISNFMVNDAFDPVRFLETFENLILKAAKIAKGQHPRVVIFGEGADLLWKKGNPEAAIQDEKLCQQLTKKYDVDILCGYSLGALEDFREDGVFRRICAEHSAVHCP